MAQNIDLIQKKFDDVFAELGFEYITVNGFHYWKHGNDYCRATYIPEWKAFVMEWANGEVDASNDVAEDHELYYLEDGVDSEVKRFREDVAKYYMD